MVNKIILTVVIFVAFLTFGGALLASNCGLNTSVKLGYDIPKDSRLKVIQNLDKLDEESLETEIKNVGKFYSDIKISEKHNKCSPMLYFNIYDEKVILSNGKYIYQFKYDIYLSPFGDQLLENEASTNYVVFKKMKAVSMYLEFMPKNGYWEIVSEGKYYSL